MSPNPCPREENIPKFQCKILKYIIYSIILPRWRRIKDRLLESNNPKPKYNSSRHRIHKFSISLEIRGHGI